MQNINKKGRKDSKWLILCLHLFTLFSLSGFVLSGCVLLTTEPAPIVTETIPLIQNEQACAGTFISHQLEHVTTVPGGNTVRMFEANGGGVAINDLDNDGDLDIVLANHAAPNTILWNEGQLHFRSERMALGDSRAVTIVDVDSDGWQDIVFTRRASAPNYWRNEGGQKFTKEILLGVDKPLYTINWADLDQDGDLDMVGGTYDAGLLADLGQEFLESDSAGVYYYENVEGRFTATRLAAQAQSLALLFIDLNEDSRLDIVVGNDFAVPDNAWYRTDSGWERAQPFTTTSHSTMSFDAGDSNNDGHLELFSTDMHPYNNDPTTLAAWQPVMASMMDAPHPAGDPQRMTNVLQTRIDRGTYEDRAGIMGVQATGWSWSGKFGDLDQDGYLDLYVVNGMIEATTFAHLPNHELVEENQAFRNGRDGRFEPMAAWQLNATQSGRGMSMADLDMDGDLDIVVNNLRGPAQLFENQLCQGASLQVDIRQSMSKNEYAIGATIALYTNRGTYHRRIQAASGYLSGDATRLHFGYPAEAALEKLEIYWPDGESSTLYNLTGNSRLQVLREKKSSAGIAD